MPRNTEKDTREEDRRRKQISEAGFRLFAEQGIETVSMNAVAEAAGGVDLPPCSNITKPKKSWS